MPFKAEDVLETIRNGSDEELKILFERCTSNFPNFYTFSKCLAENLLAETAADFPVSIVRPSIIMGTWKGSLPGYVEEGSGTFNLFTGLMKGFIYVMQADEHLLTTRIPADIVGNTHIVAAWRQVTERLPSPSVYNCNSSEHCTWNKLCSTWVKFAEKHPLPNSYRKPFIKFFKSGVAYRFHSIFDHYVPAIGIDILFWLSGSKPRLLKLYRFYEKMMSACLYFRMNEWIIASSNFDSLASKLNFTDSEMFPVDVREYSVDEEVKVLPAGAPIYKCENDKKSYQERIRTSYIRYWQTRIIKWSFIGLTIFICYSIIF